MKNHWQLINDGDVVVSNTPEELWENACKYFAWCDEHQITQKRTATTGKRTGEKYKVGYVRPYTLKGLCLHCGILEEYFNDILSSKEKNSMYSIVANRIDYVIKTQLTENAIVGIFNPVFVSRMLSLDSPQDTFTPITVNIVGGTPELSTSESEIENKVKTEKCFLENVEIETED